MRGYIDNMIETWGSELLKLITSWSAHLGQFPASYRCCCAQHNPGLLGLSSQARIRTRRSAWPWSGEARRSAGSGVVRGQRVICRSALASATPAVETQTHHRNNIARCQPQVSRLAARIRKPSLARAESSAPPPRFVQRKDKHLHPDAQRLAIVTCRRHHGQSWARGNGYARWGTRR